MVAQVEFIKSIGAFDERYYLAQFDEASKPIENIIEHYFILGSATAKNPVVWFDTSYYLAENEDVSKSGMNPLVHYLQYGIVEKRKPMDSISLALLNALDEINDIVEKIEILSKHQLLLISPPSSNSSISLKIKDEFINLINSADQNTAKNPYFDAEWYGKTYGVPIKKCWKHFCELGSLLYLAPCKQLSKSRDKLKKINGNEWFLVFMKLPHRLDFIDYKELHSVQKCYEIYCSNLFDAEWYLKNYNDIGDSITALMHFSIYGIFEEKNPNQFFNQSWYKYNYNLSDMQLPVIHYLKHWNTLAFNPNDKFNVKNYLLEHLNIRDKNIEPLSYVVHNQIREENKPKDISKINERIKPLVDMYFIKEFFKKNYLSGFSDSDYKYEEILSGYNDVYSFLAKYDVPANAFFDNDFYRKKYVIEADKLPVEHYIENNGYEADFRTPLETNSFISFKKYLTSHADIFNARHVISPIEHLLVTGCKEKRLRVVSGLIDDKIIEGLVSVTNDERFSEDSYAVSQMVLNHRLIGTKPPTHITNRTNPALSLLADKSIKILIGVVLYNNTKDEFLRLIQSIQKNNSDLLCIKTLFLTNDNNVEVYKQWISELGIAESDWVVLDSKYGNVGFGKGHNTLMQLSFSDKDRYDYYLCINPDGYLLPRSIENVIGFSRYYEDNCLVELINTPIEHPKFYDPIEFDTEWVSGASFLLPRHIWESVGGFDENIYMYCEDVDFSWRVRLNGFSLKVCPTSKYHHDVTDRFIKTDSDLEKNRRKQMLISFVYLTYKWDNIDLHIEYKDILQKNYPYEDFDFDFEDIETVSNELTTNIINFDKGFRFAESRFWN